MTKIDVINYELAIFNALEDLLTVLFFIRKQKVNV